MNSLSPKSIVQCWVDAFNKADIAELMSLYSIDSVNHQVTESPVHGREEMGRMFRDEFTRAKVTCIVENLYEDGLWAILEWRDPLGLRGRGFFRVQKGKIVFQRGYWDKLTFLRQHGLPLPKK